MRKPRPVQRYILGRLQTGNTLVNIVGNAVGMYTERRMIREHVAYASFRALRDQGWIEPIKGAGTLQHWTISAAGRAAMQTFYREEVGIGGQW